DRALEVVVPSLRIGFLGGLLECEQLVDLEPLALANVDGRHLGGRRPLIRRGPPERVRGPTPPRPPPPPPLPHHHPLPPSTPPSPRSPPPPPPPRSRRPRPPPRPPPHRPLYGPQHLRPQVARSTGDRPRRRGERRAPRPQHGPPCGER